MGSLIVLEDSTSLAENVEGFQHHVKEFLKLIEQEGNFSHDHNKSELTTRFSELLRMYKLLAAQLVSSNTKFQSLADENTKLKLEKESAQDEIRTRQVNHEIETKRIYNAICEFSKRIDTLEEEELDARADYEIEVSKFKKTAEENSKLKSELQLAQDEIRSQKANLEIEKAKVADLQHKLGDFGNRNYTLEELAASKKRKY